MKKKVLLLSCLIAALMPLPAQKMPADPLARPDQPSRGIYEKFCQRLPPDADAEAVKAAILAHKPLVQALGCDLSLGHGIASPGGYHFTFEQTWQGIPIHLAGIKANLNRQMRFMNLLDHLQAFAGTPGAFQRSEAEVAALLPQMLDSGSADFHLFPNTRCYYLQDGLLLPAHRVSYTADTRTWELILSDDDLHALLRRDAAAYRKPLGTVATDTTGNAMVFFPDPLTSSGSAYGSPYADHADGDIPALGAQRIPVNLRGLTWDGTRFTLAGPYVTLQDDEAPYVPIATSTDGSFVFERSASGFEDAMVYYHIDTFQRYVQSLGFMNLRADGILADPHGLNGEDNSHYVAAESRIAFGEGGVDDAEDADVIIHEYGHALSDAGSPGSNTGWEREGLDEGMGDYLATTWSRGLSYAFWKNVFTWDGHNEFWDGRSASDPTLYPPPTTSSIYLYGTIWVSTLMEVWPLVGKEASDRIFLESLYGNSPYMTLTDAALAYLDADSNLYGGAHHAYFQDAFCRRGILTGTRPSQPCHVGTEQGLAPGFTWEVFPNPAHGSVQLLMEGYRPGHGFRYSIIDLLGRVLLSGPVTGVLTAIGLDPLPPGVYLLQLGAKDGWMPSRRLRIL
ncbi:MAG: hypothetical protein RLZZ165_1979 [Bacteroidota bacterium]